MIIFSKDCSIALINKIELSTGYFRADEMYVFSKNIISNTTQLGILRNYYSTLEDKDLLLLLLELRSDNLFSIKDVFPVYTKEFGKVKHNIELLNYLSKLLRIKYGNLNKTTHISKSLSVLVLSDSDILENYIYKTIEELVDNKVCTKSDILKLLYNYESWRIHWFF